MPRPRPKDIARSVEAIIVLVASAALLIWVPQRYFLATAMGMLGSAFVVLWLVKKYLDRLNRRMASLKSKGRHDEATALKTREFLLIDVATVFTMAGLAAFVGLIIVYAD